MTVDTEMEGELRLNRQKGVCSATVICVEDFLVPSKCLKISLAILCLQSFLNILCTSFLVPVAQK